MSETGQATIRVTMAIAGDYKDSGPGVDHDLMDEKAHLVALESRRSDDIW